MIPVYMVLTLIGAGTFVASLAIEKRASVPVGAPPANAGLVNALRTAAVIAMTVGIVAVCILWSAAMPSDLPPGASGL